MPRKPLTDLPDESRVWIFGADRPLTDAEADRVGSAVDEFLETWTAHGHPLTSGGEWRYGRFLLVAVDERSVPPSGCSIDAMVRALKALGEESGFDMVDNAPVWYRDANGELRRVARPVFAASVQDGAVDGDTVVFDNTVTRLGQVRSGRWETRAGLSWHARAFRLKTQS